MARRILVLSLLIAALLCAAALVAADAQPIVQVPTDTPAQINLSVVTQPQPQVAGPTATRTPTPQGIALLEAKDFANVRSAPSTDASQLGTIRTGDKYNVIGRYISWIEFQYQSSPTGTGWVFGDLVNLTGNVDNIPDVDPYSQSQADAGSVNATGTQNILTQTPGGVLTATALAQIIAPGGTAAPTNNGTQEILPTFTYPPGIVAIAPTPGASVSTEATPSQPSAPASDSTDLPPIVPILALGALGLLGLAISALRRG